MNKKFFTLIAAMLFGAFTVNAQIADTDGKYTYIKSGSDYLSITKHGTADSLIVVTDKAAAGDSALWVVDLKEVNNSGDSVFTFTNKLTGNLLSLEKKTGASTVIKTGVDSWVAKLGVISSTFAVGQAQVTLAFNVASNKLTNPMPATSTTAFELEAPGLKVLTADDLKAGLTSFSLTVEGTNFLSNIFNGKDLMAVKPSAQSLVDEGWVKIQVIGDEKIGTKNAYLGLDTVMQNVAPHDGAFGATFTVDSVWKKGEFQNDSLQLFKIVQNLADETLKLYVLKAPVFFNAGVDDKKWNPEGKADSVVVVQQTVGTQTVLTVSEQTGTANGTVPHDFAGYSNSKGRNVKITFTKGDPTKFAGKTGVYFIYYLDSRGDKYYLQGDTVTGEPSPTGAIKSGAKNIAPKAYSPVGQFYVVVNEDGTIKAADRNFNVALTSGYAASEVYTRTEGTYRIARTAGDAIGKDLYFVYQDIAAGAEKAGEYHYLATKYISPAEAAQNAYTLKVISGVPGVDDLYTSIKDSNLIANGGITIEEAAKFKVLLNSVGKVWTGGPNYEVTRGVGGVGALALTDTLATATYKLYKQYSTDSLFLGNDKAENANALLIKKAEPAAIVSFKFVDENKYDMVVAGQNIALNFETAKLVEYAGGQPNYFDLEVVGAPNYANFGGNGHKVTASSEDDNKRLNKAAAGIDALLNFIADEENYSLYYQVANTDEAKPLYYITTQIGLTEEEKEKGNFFFLSNPAGFLGNAEGAAAKFADDDSRFVDQVNGVYKAVFVKGVFDADTVKVFGTNFGENVKDTLYKTLEGNPLVFAFATTPEGGVKIESGSKARTVTGLRAAGDASYLQVINNTLRWANALDKGHGFSVEATDIIPTDNINPEAGFEVYTAGGGIIVKGAANQVAVITNVLGQTIAVQTLGSDYETITLPAGVAFITINGETVKAYVK